VMWDKQRPDGIVEGWHGDGNFARTTIMYGLWKTQGVTFHPWREDVRLGAARAGDRLLLSLRSDRPWKGRLLFDRPRHAQHLKLPLDWPRINQFPEWFVVKEGRIYGVTDAGSGRGRIRPAAELRRGLPVETDGRSERYLVVREQP
jgi:hypothetical protein